MALLHVDSRHAAQHDFDGAALISTAARPVHIIDAYARAIATAGTDPKTEQSRKEWQQQLLNYYKFRNNGSDAGLAEFIAAAPKKPLPPKP